MIWLAAFALGAEVTAEATARVIEMLPDEVVVDRDGRTADWGPSVDTRLRAGALVEDGWLRLGTEWDLLTGQVAGRPWDLSELDERGRHERTELSQVVPRKLYLGARTPIADLEVGLVTSHWGLGMLANDGTGRSLFGREDFGDRVARVRLATRPLGAEKPLILVVAGDRVIADEQARMDRDEQAYQGVVALVWQQEELTAGLYGVLRDQVNPDGRVLNAHVVDAYAQWASESVNIAAEGAYLGGQTDILRTYDAPEGVRVRSGGAAARIELSDDRRRLWLMGAWASGDGNSGDDTLSLFRFDRDFNMGMTMFDEVAAAQTLGAIELAGDPGVAAQAPDGVDNLADEGAFGGSLAVQPALQLPVEFVDVRAGVMWAWATGAPGSVVETVRNGGFPADTLGNPIYGRFLGTELNWSLATVRPAWKVQPVARIQAGHLLGGPALGGVNATFAMLSMDVRVATTDAK